MYLLTNKSSREIGLPAPCGSVILAINETQEIADWHYQELVKSTYTANAIAVGSVVVEYRKDRAKPKPQRGVKTVSQKGGGYRVFVNDHEVTDEPVRKSEAQRIAAEYE